MGMLDNILAQVLSPQGNSPLVADLEKAATDAIAAGNTTPGPKADPDDPTGTDATATTTDGPVAETPANDVPKVDVAAMLDKLQDQSAGDLDWRKSIVDLLKLLGQDSSLSARKQLAGELSYDGDTDDSAAMNVWLHKAVMTKLAENGGKLPDDL